MLPYVDRLPASRPHLVRIIEKPAMNIKHFYILVKKSVTAWIDDYAPSMGAAISYYTVFSIAPLLLIVIAVAGFVWGREAVQGQIVDQLSGLIGKEGATGIQALIKSANKPVQGFVATAISIVILIIGATTVFAELQSSLDRIWNVPAAKKASGIWATLRARLLSLGFILGLGFLLSVSLVFSAGVAAFGTWANGLFPGWETILQIVNLVISLGIATVLFAMIYKLMPQASVGWRDVWIGAGVTAVLFEVGKTLIGLYIGKSGVTSSFAAAGSLVVLLVWVYYSAQIFLLGAEFTWAYAQDHGSLSGKDKQAKANTGKAAKQGTPALGMDAVSAGSPVASPVVSFGAPAVATQSSPRIPAPARPKRAAKARPTFKQRAIAYMASTAINIALETLLKRYAAKSDKIRRQGQGRARHSGIQRQRWLRGR
jgi:membrane protein